MIATDALAALRRYIPVTELTYGVIGPALACAPLNSIIVMDNLAQFFAVIPTHERGVRPSAIADVSGIMVFQLVCDAVYMVLSCVVYTGCRAAEQHQRCG